MRGDSDVDGVVIAGYVRSPMTPAIKGELAEVRPDEIAGQVIRGLVERSGVDVNDVEGLLLGCSSPEAEQELDTARLAGFLADLPVPMAAVTFERFCGSSMQAIHTAAGAVLLNAGKCFICAGVESVTRAPIWGFDPSPQPGLRASYAEACTSIGMTVEDLGRKYEVSRQEQEVFAAESHRKAAQAATGGRFDDEIVPIKVGLRTISRDGCIRPDTTPEILAALKPVFSAGDTVTAGLRAPLADGAAAVLVCSERYALDKRLDIMARVRSVAVSGCSPEMMGLGPVASTRKALQRAGLVVEDMDVIEIDEAFAAQTLAVVKELGVDQSRLNLDGGAVALGHPLCASGARITGKAASLLKREHGRYALATMCIGVGKGIATVLEAI